MTAQPGKRLKQVLLCFTWSAIAIVAAIDLLALVGWIYSNNWLKTLRWNSPHSAMNPTTAIGQLLISAALAIAVRKPAAGAKLRRVFFFCAGLVALLGLLKLASLWLPIPIDGLLFATKAAKTPIAPQTGAALVTIGFSLLLLDVRAKRRFRPAIPLALVAATIALLAITGYFYDVMWFYTVKGYIPMAMNTAAGFLLQALAILAVRPEEDPIATLLSDTAGGVVARRLLPAAALAPLAVGWLCLLGYDYKFYERPFGLTLYSLLTTILFVTLTWWNARFLVKLDTSRRRAEREAAEEHHLLRVLIDNLPDSVFVKDVEHRFLLNNIAHARTLGAQGPEQLLGKSDLDFFSPEFSNQFRAEEREAIRTGVPFIEKEQFITDSRGAPHVLSVTKVPFRDTEGKVIGIVGIARDISVRKQIEQERDRFFTLSADMMCIAGFDGYFKRVNPAFETTLGYSAEELTAVPWTDFVHPDDVASTTAEGQKLAIGAVTLYFENRYRCKDGSYRWVSWTAVPVVREARIYAVARDTTERRRVEEQLREANRKLEEAVQSERSAQQRLLTAQSGMIQTEKLAGIGQMVAGVAHEINNPLSFVSNNVAVLQRDLRGVLHLIELYRQADGMIQRERPELMAEIQTTARQIDLNYVLSNLQDLLLRSRDGLRRIQQIVKDLRNFARLDESDLQEADLNEGIRSTLTIIHGHARKHEVEIDAELENLPPVTCYPAKINQVVMNLLTNAVDASGSGGRITVRTRIANEDSVQISVSDTGSGIDPAVLPRIFDPFFTTKPQGHGTGLGLSISYGIVQDHGGKIDVQSELGRGTTFTVTLPIKNSIMSVPRHSRSLADSSAAGA